MNKSTMVYILIHIVFVAMLWIVHSAIEDSEAAQIVLMVFFGLFFGWLYSNLSKPVHDIIEALDKDK